MKSRYLLLKYHADKHNLPKTYHTDLTKHDKAMLQDYDGPFVWFLMENGTVMFRQETRGFRQWIGCPHFLITKIFLGEVKTMIFFEETIAKGRGVIREYSFDDEIEMKDYVKDYLFNNF